MERQIKKILSHKGAAICEVVLDRNYIFSPKQSSERKADGTMVAKPLEDLYPFLERDEFYSNMIIKNDKLENPETAIKIKLFAFDLDGTLYTGEHAAAGAVKIIDYLRENYKVVFFTNNSSKTIIQVCEKLTKLGIKCNINEVYTSSAAAALYLKESDIDKIFVVGSQGLRNELQKQGLTVVDDSSAENLLVGLDFGFNYNKITDALSILLKGGKFIVCNEDCSFPVEENRRMPGCGAMVGAISAAAGRKPDFVVGKPNAFILSRISEDFGVKYNEIVVVGDSYESDIQMAMNYNSKAVLISNKSVKYKNIIVAKNLKQLQQLIRKEIV
jgi:HAD superfamily hydrolase (TIGR01450 family)